MIIEAPLTILEVEVKVLLWGAVVAAHMSLGLVPKVLDAIDVIAVIREYL